MARPPQRSTTGSWSLLQVAEAAGVSRRTARTCVDRGLLPRSGYRATDVVVARVAAALLSAPTSTPAPAPVPASAPAPVAVQPGTGAVTNGVGVADGISDVPAAPDRPTVSNVSNVGVVAPAASGRDRHAVSLARQAAVSVLDMLLPPPAAALLAVGAREAALLPTAAHAGSWLADRPGQQVLLLPVGVWLADAATTLAATGFTRNPGGPGDPDGTGPLGGAAAQRWAS